MERMIRQINTYRSIRSKMSLMSFTVIEPMITQRKMKAIPSIPTTNLQVRILRI